MIRRYVHGSGVDEPLVVYEGGAVSGASRRQLFADWQGSIVGAADGNGALIAANRYDSWGNVPMSGTSNWGRFQYTGQLYLPELGVYHYKARAYMPTIGRFMQTDPIGYEDQYNLYAYVGNDPVNMVDPTGEEAACITSGHGCVDSNLTWADIANRGLRLLEGIAIGADLLLGGPTGESAPVLAMTTTARNALARGTGGFTARRVEGVLVHRGVLGRGALGGQRGTTARINLLRNAATQKGNYSLGSATQREAASLGRSWVGDGARLASDGRTLLSRDGLRQFRPPTQKRDGSIQANFERRFQDNEGKWHIIGNGHLRVVR